MATIIAAIVETIFEEKNDFMDQTKHLDRYILASQDFWESPKC